MNEYEMMENKVNQLRDDLTKLHENKERIQLLINYTLLELLDTRRQLTRLDKIMITLTTPPTEAQLEIHTNGCETWLGLSCNCGRSRLLAPVDYLDV